MINPYKLYRSSTPTTRKELDLREELNRTLFGAGDEIAKGRYGLLRKMRRDSNDYPIQCPCRDQATFEADKDPYCRYCVVGSTIIPTKDGIKQANEITPGMQVLAGDGEYHTVKKTFGRIYSGEMIELHIAGRTDMPLKLTTDHPVFVYRNENVCHRKRAFGKICMPEFCKAPTCKKRIENPDGFSVKLLEIPAGEIKPTDYLVLPRVKEDKDPIKYIDVNWDKYRASNTPKCNFPKKLLVDKDLMYILGWFVAEGSGSHGGRKTRSVIYSLHRDKEQHVAIKLLKIFKEKFGISGQAKNHSNKQKKSTQVIFNNSVLSRWFNDICGRYSDFKKVPAFVWACSQKLQEVFLDNFMLGDGHRDNQDWEATGIVSKVLAEEIYILSSALGYSPFASFRPAYQGSDGLNHADSWTVAWSAVRKQFSHPPKWRYRFYNENFIVSSIKEVKRYQDIVSVYDFTVSDVPSFIADGILVHNCWGSGYYWDEYRIVFYRTHSFGSNKYTFYFEYGADITDIDLLVEVKLDGEGKPVSPLKRIKVYDIIEAEKLYSDYGRVEFWQVETVEREEWSIWYGAENRQHH
jgi:hypothetical protein